MTDLLVLRPPKRSRSRRLRKKLHIGEFQVLGFDYELTWRVAPSIDVQDRFIDQLLEDLVAPRALSLGGGVNCGFVAVFRDSPVRLAISLLLIPSRSFMRRTLPIISMVITFGLLLPKNSAVA